MPTLLLITASSPDIQRVRRSRVLNFQQITMPYLAAFVPSHWTVRHIDEFVAPVDFAVKADLVAITFHTPTAPHVYAMSERIRLMGIPVVVGGPHVTLMPDEAQMHADVVFVGEAETIWPQFLREFETGDYRKRYHSAEPPSLNSVPMARKDLFHRRDHTAGVLFATRGCSYRCDFCTLAVMYPSQVRQRPISEVAEEYGSFRGKVVVLWDDNIACDLKYAKALFRALTPHRKWWSSQASIQAAQDEEFLELAAKSGCKQLFLGLESISQDSVNDVHKGFNRVTDYMSAIQRIHSFGIAVQAGLVFGFDHDTPHIFRETVDFLEATGVQNATFNILTPFPGTRLYERFQAEGRILTRDWSKYNGRADVVFRPRLMTSEQLLAGFKYANQRFYSLKSIGTRMAQSSVGLPWALPLNLSYAWSWTSSAIGETMWPWKRASPFPNLEAIPRAAERPSPDSKLPANS